MEHLKIIKRDGKQIEFDPSKIEAAILAANKDSEPDDRVSLELAKEISLEILGEISEDMEFVDIEFVQDEVIRHLYDHNHPKLGLAYSEYRKIQEIKRAPNSIDEGLFALLHHKDKEAEEENSNKNIALISTQRDYVAGNVSKDLTDRYLIPESVRKAHEEGEIHFHDKDYFIHPGMFNCCLINIGDMLDNGTAMNGKKIDPPKGFQVACTVMTQIIASIASNQYGGQSVDIRHLGKYLRKSEDKIREQIKSVSGLTPEQVESIVSLRLKEELKAGVQTIQYQINTLMTTNGQSPFVTIFLNLKQDDEYIEENAQIIEEVLKQRILGIKNDCDVYITPAFPKLVYVLDEHNALNGGDYDYLTRLAAKCSIKRMYPDYISAKKMRENKEGNVFSPMGCRSFLSPWKDVEGNYKFEGRFNQGVVTLNLPQIGIVCSGDEEKFWKILDDRLDVCFEALMCRHNALLGATSDCSPVHWQNGGIARLKPGEKIDSLLLNGYSTLSLGYIGVYEMTLLVTGESSTTEDGEQFALKVIEYLSDRCKQWKEKTTIGFALYGSPAESLCYRLAKIDEQKYGVIKDVTDKGYYTNSYHVDVREHIDAFKKFDFESQFQALSSGGCISYAEIPNMRHNPEAVESLINYIYDNIQYAEFNTKSDYCHICSFDGEIAVNQDNIWECPNCKNTDKTKMTVVRRTCGYLGENYWNEGKTKEIANRVIHI